MEDFANLFSTILVKIEAGHSGAYRREIQRLSHKPEDSALSLLVRKTTIGKLSRKKNDYRRTFREDYPRLAEIFLEI